MQYELFGYRRDNLFKSENKIAKYYDVLNETENEIRYAEFIDPKKGYAIAGIEYEEYVDVKKDKLKGLTYDQILSYLKNAKKEDRLEKYKALLKFGAKKVSKNFIYNSNSNNKFLTISELKNLITEFKEIYEK